MRTELVEEKDRIEHTSNSYPIFKFALDRALDISAGNSNAFVQGILGFVHSFVTCLVQYTTLFPPLLLRIFSRRVSVVVVVVGSSSSLSENPLPLYVHDSCL